MTIAQVQKVEASATAGTTASVTYSPAPVEGNLMVAVIVTEVAKTLVVPSGWTLIVSITNTVQTSLFFKVAGAGEGTTHNWTWTGNTDSVSFGHEYSGTSATPLDQSDSKSDTNTSPRTGIVTPSGSASTVLVGGIGIFRGVTLTSPVGGFTIENEEIVTNVSGDILEKITVGGSSEEGGGALSASKSWGGVIASFLADVVPLQRARRRMES